DDQKDRDKGNRGLDKMARENKDEDAREAAKALRDLRQTEGQAKESEPQTKTAQGDRKDGQANKGKEQPAQAKGKGQDDKTETAKTKTDKMDPEFQPTTKAGTPRPEPGWQGSPPVKKEWDPTAAFTKKGGELNLDELKNIPKKVRDDAG